MSTDRLSNSPLELARRLGVLPQTVQRWVDADRPVARNSPAGHRRIHADSAERLIGDRAVACARTAGASRPRSARPLAVVVDDNVLDRERLAHGVRRTLPGAWDECAENAFQGRMLVVPPAPPPVRADVRTPHMNGVAMLRLLAGRPGRGPRAAVAASAHARKDLGGRGRLPDGVSFRPKPVDHDRLVRMVRAHVDGAQAAGAAFA